MHVRISWDEVPGARRYEVHRADHEEGPYVWYADSLTPAYSDERVVFGQVYWYRVRACSADLCSAWSAGVFGYAQFQENGGDPGGPDVPRNVVATQGTYTDRISIAWDLHEGAGTYRVLRGESGAGPYQEIATVYSNMHEDSHGERNPLRGCHGYAYRVVACTSAGCSAMSAVAEGWRGVALEGTNPPTGLYASIREFSDRVRITWDPVPGATGYVVYRGHVPVEVGTATEPSYDDVHDAVNNPLTIDRWYSYWVRACGDDDCGCTELSHRIEGRPAPNPGTPMGLSTATAASRVTVRWIEGPSIIQPTHYVVLRSSAQEETYTVIGETRVPALEYHDDEIETGVYWYRIRAVNEYGESELSEPISAHVP